MVLTRLIQLVGNKVGPDDGVTADGAGLSKQAESLLDGFLGAVSRQQDRFTWQICPVDYPAGRAILDADRSLQPVVVCLGLERLACLFDARSYGQDLRALEVLVGLLCRRLDYQTNDLRRTLGILADHASIWRPWRFPLVSLVRSIERWIEDHGCPPEIRAELERLRAQGRHSATHAGERKAVAALDTILGAAEGTPEPFDPADDWGYAALDTWRQLDQADRLKWRGLIAHAVTARGTKPTKPWLKRATEQIEAIGREESQKILVTSLRLLGAPARPVEGRDVARLDVHGQPAPTSVPVTGNADVLKGLAWCCSLYGDPVVASAVGDAAEWSLKKIPGIGPRTTKVGNACIYALGAVAGMHGVAQLQRLRQRVKPAPAIALIDTALNAAAQPEGMTREDLDDLAVPTFDLVDGRRREQFGEFAAEIVVAGTQEIEVRWYGADGKPRKSEPAEAKRQFGEELKALKRTADDLRKTLPAQRDRIERLPMAERSWPYAAWKERYLDHPLLSLLTRRLIWRFDEGDRVTLGAWHDGVILDAGDRPLDGLSEGTRVRLWHPIEADAATVEAWQDWLDRHAVTQPFKQAHREVYVLTDAEVTTETYSNRFASHILRQHQFLALCQQRGWSYRLQGWYDSSSVPTVELPHYWDWAVEYWVEPITDGDESMSPSGVSLYVSSDQVRFRRRRFGDPMALADVPPLVFSEVMRDVDLFVAVCSVGNDPTWADQGPQGHQGYWHAAAFTQDLSASAKTRRIVLERLLPRLKIAARCAVTDNFLVVRGDLRTYKIHLGSGNIMMEPNNQYLCIVPSRGAAAKDPAQGVLLPFEGDGMLTIILSKAFLLADDTAITDPTITRQLRR